MKFEIEGDLLFQLDLLLNQGLDLFDNFRLPVELGIETQFNQQDLFWPDANVQGLLINNGDGNLRWGPVEEAGGQVDHGSTLGLGDDDHTQYILEDGTRAFSGNISHGGKDITSVGALAGLLSDAAQTNVTSLGTLVRLNTAVVTKTTTYIATATDHIILCDASGGAFTVTLPASSGISGREYHVKKTDSSANAVTVDGNGSETIDGDLTVDISTQYESLMLVTDGSNWHVL